MTNKISKAIVKYRTWFITSNRQVTAFKLFIMDCISSQDSIESDHGRNRDLRKRRVQAKKKLVCDLSESESLFDSDYDWD